MEKGKEKDLDIFEINELMDKEEKRIKELKQKEKKRIKELKQKEKKRIKEQEEEKKEQELLKQLEEIEKAKMRNRFRRYKKREEEETISIITGKTNVAINNNIRNEKLRQEIKQNIDEAGNLTQGGLNDIIKKMGPAYNKQINRALKAIEKIKNKTGKDLELNLISSYPSSYLEDLYKKANLSGEEIRDLNNYKLILDNIKKIYNPEEFNIQNLKNIKDYERLIENLKKKIYKMLKSKKYQIPDYI